MATGSEIAEQVLDIVQDPSFDEDFVITKLNECAGALSRRLVLPSLDTEADVVALASASSVSLPVTYQRNLYHCRNAAGYPIQVYNSRAQLLVDHGEPWGRTGVNIRGVAPEGRSLVYAPTPTTDTTLTVRFQRKPTVITLSAQVDLLPDGFDDIFVHYACWGCFAMIEQGMEGTKVDTNYYMALYSGLRDELWLSLNEGVSLPPPPIARMERW
jgi:hypothetical protein